jgi:uncharacterized protein (DUF58 family)
LLIIIAATMRDDFALTLIYLFVGAFVLGTWWSRKSLAQVKTEREFTSHAFLGEKVRVDLKFHNRGWLPILWLNLHDALPVGLSTIPAFAQVTGLGPKSEARFSYILEARKRGYYPVGPLLVSTGDIFGLGTPLEHETPRQHLTVYPKIIPLTSIEIPSRSPQGTLRHTRPIFEDPTRVFSKREYVAGDSLRRVDWKATATTGRLQVKLFEPSIALETLIFLDLNPANYPPRHQIDSTELAIVIAASLATWIAGKSQTVGLKVNGKDPLTEDGQPQYLPPRKGQAHLMRLLEILARAEMSEGASFETLIQRQRYHLAWGTTLLVITGKASVPLLDELYQARRAGQNASLILAGPAVHAPEMIRRAAHFGIPLVNLAIERDLDLWRK